MKRLKRPRTPQLRILPYKMGSKGATLLAEGLRMVGQKCFKVFPNKGYIPRPLHTIINWGSGNAPNWNTEETRRVLNHPYYVRGASNKLTAFQMMQEAGVSIPEFTGDRDVANDWKDNGSTIVNRSKLNGHSGDGISISVGDQVLPHVPLYVKYIKKQHEYRVHVFKHPDNYPYSEGGGGHAVIDIQMKRKKREVENDEVDYQVRNHANGWVYCRDGIDPPTSVLSDATSAVAALGLDFGAVDIIWNQHQGRSYVLEVNTSPGLEGTTLTKYVEAIQSIIGEV